MNLAIGDYTIHPAYGLAVVRALDDQYLSLDFGKDKGGIRRFSVTLPIVQDLTKATPEAVQSTKPVVPSTGLGAFDAVTRQRITRLQKTIADISIAKFPEFLSPGEVATLLNRSVDGIPSIARAFRNLRDHYKVESMSVSSARWLAGPTVVRN